MGQLMLVIRRGQDQEVVEVDVKDDKHFMNAREMEFLGVELVCEDRRAIKTNDYPRWNKVRPLPCDNAR